MVINDILLDRSAVLKAVKADREMLEAIKAVSEARTVPLVEGGKAHDQATRKAREAAVDELLTFGRHVTEDEKRCAKAVDAALDRL